MSGPGILRNRQARAFLAASQAANFLQAVTGMLVNAALIRYSGAP